MLYRNICATIIERIHATHMSLRVQGCKIFALQLTCSGMKRRIFLLDIFIKTVSITLYHVMLYLVLTMLSMLKYITED